MGNFRRHGGLVALMIVFLLVASLFGGYKFITCVNPEVDKKFNEVAEDTLGIDIEAIREQRRADNEKKKQEKEESKKTKNDRKKVDFELSSDMKKILNDPYTYKDQNTRNYNGPVIHTVGTYLINTEGKILKDFYDEEGYRLNLSKNVDGSEAVLIDEKKLFYIDADLNLTKIADGVRGAGICYEGGYFYYIQEKESFPYEIMIYDVAAKKSTKVGETNISEAAISPDGQTLAFCRSGEEKELLTCKIGEEPGVIDKGTRLSPLTVSNDGQTVFYESFDTSDGVFCIHDGTKTRICETYIHAAYFDRDCTQILLEDKDYIKYYRAGDKSAVTLWDQTYNNYSIFNVSYMETLYGNDRFIIDTDSFADVVMIDDYSEYYCLKGDTPVMYKLVDEGNNVYSVHLIFGDNGPGGLYQQDGNIYRTVYDGNSESKEIVHDGSKHSTSGFAVSDDGRQIWISYYSENALYYSKDGGDPVKVTGDDYKASYEMSWNPLDGKCYYISDDKLYSVGDGSEDPKFISDNADWFSYASADFDTIAFKSVKNDSKVFVVLFDELLTAQ